MTTYESVREETRKFGKTSYLEVSRKRLVEPGESTPTDFLLVTRGFYDASGAKKWTRFVTLPDEPDVKRWLVEALGRV